MDAPVRWEACCRGHAGGVLGWWLGAAVDEAARLRGSGVLWIALLVLGMPLALRFSWRAWPTHRRAGRRLARAPRRARERAEDVASANWRCASASTWSRSSARCRGPRADRDRAAGARGAEVRARRSASARSRCSSSSPTPSCRRSTCSTPRPARVETVTPESLEMTSRLIEKKLKDFGVEVRVVAARPAR
jgi:S-DNA-T family DNA segregation ATPase FtsK/SpoIIIE